MKEIQLTRGKVALIDDADYEEINKYKWCANKNPGRYARRGVMKNGTQHTIIMHRVLLNVPHGIFVDHIDGDGLNNQRYNIRICTNSQNQHNQCHRVGHSSCYKGVSYHKSNNRWQAQIQISGVGRHLGYFTNEEDAAHAYNAAAIKGYGRFARLNDFIL